MTRVLIAEDEQGVASFLEKGLRAKGFATRVVSDGSSAAVLARDEDFDILLLDLGLPGKDGTEVLREIRARGERLPVVILTARDDVRDKVAGLEGGADDYVTKPFRFEELLARIRVRMRAPEESEPLVLTAGPMTLDVRERRATVREHAVDLTSREFRMLETFMRRPGQLVTRDELLSEVWGREFEPGSNVVEVYIRYLRQKLGGDVIETVRGAGYRLAV